MIHRYLLAGVTLVGLSSTVLAGNGRNPGSLLLYPEFDNREGTFTILTVTNVDIVETNDPIDVEFVYVGGDDCQEFNRTETLTPGDTFTCLADVHNPEDDNGYVFVYAKEWVGQPQNGSPKTHNYLIGNVITCDGFDTWEFSMNPFSFEGSPIGGEQNNGDADLLLDGQEYSGVSQDIIIPRFFGQTASRRSELILLDLTGGPGFSTTVDFLIWNDNEEIFSSEYTFDCWEREKLKNISGIFKNHFLKNWTNDDPDELLGASQVETGWMHIHGHLTQDMNDTTPDPAVCAVLIESFHGHSSDVGLADLPFESGEELTNGSLRAVSN